MSHVLFPSLEPLAEKVAAHLMGGHDTALIAAPGSGITTFLPSIANRLRRSVVTIDLRAFGSGTRPVDLLRQFTPVADGPFKLVLVLDHAAALSLEDQREMFVGFRAEAERLGATCLWVGALDSRAIQADFGVRINSVPKSHFTMPMLPRDELLSAYRAIAASQECHWGDAILFLLLDLCGNDLALVHSITAYLYGDWSGKLYDVSVWDRINEWIANDPAVDGYRRRLASIADKCRGHLNLIRLGGKPPCLRSELREETDGELRTLWLQGFLVQNLLPGFYQIRNLTARLLLTAPGQPDMLFRRTANERAGQLLQDVESMLRYLVQDVFGRLGEAAACEILKNKQSEGEFIPPAFNKALMNWADKAGGGDLKKGLVDLVKEHRDAFREKNSVWEKVSGMMVFADGAPHAADCHLRCIEFLTLAELGDVLMQSFDAVFPRAAADAHKKSTVKDRWLESLAMVRRLRNDVAHLRNVSFQDMEDLAGTVERMRKDLIEFSGWR